jgi:hypothetical protein
MAQSRSVITDLYLAPEEVARRYARRPGFRLVNFMEVGLPLWRLNIRCMTLAHRPVTPLQEFTLKSLDAGLKSIEQVSAFLGLHETLGTATIATLVKDELLLPTAAPSSEDVLFVVSPKGKRVLEEAERILAEPRIYPLQFDGLTRKFIPPSHVPLYRPKELRDQGIMEIPPFPADPPKVDDLSLGEVSGIVSSLASPTEIKRDLLAIEAIEGRKERLFQRAVALVYEALGGLEVQVAFAIDGRLSEEHERAFATAEGARKLGIIQALRAEAAEDVAKEVLGEELVRRSSDAPEVQALRQVSETLRVSIDEAQRRLSSAEQPSERDAALNQLQEAREKLTTAESALAEIPVRPLEVYEHPPLLREAFESANERVMVISPWIRAAVVDKAFLSRLEDTLKRGVSVFVGYGSGDDEKAFDRDKRAEKELMSLSTRHENFHLARFGDTHAKVLVVDEKFLVVSSFNWLSFKGDPERPFRDERGILVAIPETIQQVFESFVQRFEDSN